MFCFGGLVVRYKYWWSDVGFVGQHFGSMNLFGWRKGCFRDAGAGFALEI